MNSSNIASDFSPPWKEITKFSLDPPELCRPGVSALTMVHLLHELGAQKQFTQALLLSLYIDKGNWNHTQQVLSEFKCIFSSKQSLWEPNEYFGSEKETMNSLFAVSHHFQLP